MVEFYNVEFKSLKSHNAISSLWGGTRKNPYALTEQGVYMYGLVLVSNCRLSTFSFIHLIHNLSHTHIGCYIQ